jgi:hypothetical protein
MTVWIKGIQRSVFTTLEKKFLESRYNPDKLNEQKSREDVVIHIIFSLHLYTTTEDHVTHTMSPRPYHDVLHMSPPFTLYKTRSGMYTIYYSTIVDYIILRDLRPKVKETPKFRISL